MFNEAEKRDSQIVIVGGGIVGHSLASRLADNGLHPVIISNAEELVPDWDTRRSTPVILRSIAEKLGLPNIGNESAVEFRMTRSGLNTLLSDVLCRASRRYLAKDPLLALDINDMERRLHDQASQHPNITIQQGRFVDVLMGKGRLTGVIVDTPEGKKEVAADLVFDATGRVAAVARKVEKVRPGTIKERVVPQPSTIVGGYVELNTDGLEDVYPHTDKAIYVGGLPDKLLVTLVPSVQFPQSPSTNLFLIEGNPVAISKAHKKANGDHLAMFDLLTQDTSWNRMVRKIRHLDRTVLFQYKNAVMRCVIDVKGLVLIGDAFGHTNPVFGYGLAYAARDILEISKNLIGTTSQEDLDNAVLEFRQYQNDVASERLNTTDKQYHRIKYLFRLHSFMSLVNTTARGLFESYLELDA